MHSLTATIAPRIVVTLHPIEKQGASWAARTLTTLEHHCSSRVEQPSISSMPTVLRDMLHKIEYNPQHAPTDKPIVPVDLNSLQLSYASRNARPYATLTAESQCSSQASDASAPHVSFAALPAPRIV